MHTKHRNSVLNLQLNCLTFKCRNPHYLNYIYMTIIGVDYPTCGSI